MIRLALPLALFLLRPAFAQDRGKPSHLDAVLAKPPATGMVITIVVCEARMRKEKNFMWAS